jgi:hypothetical protein
MQLQTPCATKPTAKHALAAELRVVAAAVIVQIKLCSLCKQKTTMLFNIPLCAALCCTRILLHRKTSTPAKDAAACRL